MRAGLSAAPGREALALAYAHIPEGPSCTANERGAPSRCQKGFAHQKVSIGIKPTAASKFHNSRFDAMRRRIPIAAHSPPTVADDADRPRGCAAIRAGQLPEAARVIRGWKRHRPPLPVSATRSPDAPREFRCSSSKHLCRPCNGRGLCGRESEMITILGSCNN